MHQAEVNGPERVPVFEPTRRGFLQGGLYAGAAAFGWPFLERVRTGGPEPKAQAVIQVFLSGGMSHLDTFDPKPEAAVEVRGSFRAIDTAVQDLQFSELCNDLAKVADRLVVMRAMSHTEAAHERGRANILTGYRPSPAVVYPSFGAVVSHELGVRHDLPPYVCIPNAGLPDLGTGYLSSAFGPFSLGDEPNDRNFKVRDLVPDDGIDDDRLERRQKLLATLDASFETDADAVTSTETFYKQAWRLIGSDAAREAFRIDLEPKELRDRYGRNGIGQRLLLSRRLIEAGVRFVAVLEGGWDLHRGIDGGMRGRMPAVDRGLAALIGDLEERGLLDSTLVLMTTEFGRTPRINRDRGRDHWPRAFSVLAAGGGLKRGVVHGETSPDGSEPVRDAISPADLAATVYTQLGIDPDKRLISPGDRPIQIVRDGRVLRELLA